MRAKDYMILSVLNNPEKEVNVFEFYTALKKRFGERAKKVTYNNFNQLKERGWVNIEYEIDNRKSGERFINSPFYSITPEGKQALSEERQMFARKTGVDVRYFY